MSLEFKTDGPWDIDTVLLITRHNMWSPFEVDGITYDYRGGRERAIDFGVHYGVVRPMMQVLDDLWECENNFCRLCTKDLYPPSGAMASNKASLQDQNEIYYRTNPVEWNPDLYL